MRVWTIFAVAIVACSSTTTTDAGSEDASAESGAFVCCPIVGTQCSYGGGGWATSADQCSKTMIFDAYEDITTDDHGCPTLKSNLSKCCGCVPMMDSGIDATSDAPSDAPDGS